MCGILGAISKNKNIHSGVIKALFIANQSRGYESTGYASLKNGNIDIVKRAVSPIEFVNDLKLGFAKDMDIIIGHTRLATTGAVTDKNSHPFRMGDVVGTHNGMISNHYELGKYEVDSMAVFDMIDQYGVKGLEKVTGSASLSYLIDDDNSLRLISHNNPLSIAITKDAIYYSSEYCALSSVIVSSGIDFESIEELDADTLYTIGKNLKIKKSPVKFKKYFYQNYSSYNPKEEDGFDFDDDGFDEAYSEYEEDIKMFTLLAQSDGCSICFDNCNTGYLDNDNHCVVCNKCASCFTKKELAKMVRI